MVGRRAAGLAAATLLLAGCGAVEIAEYDLTAEDAAACAAFTEALPATLVDQERVEVEPENAFGAAYGDPAIVVTCGVPEPDGFGPGSSCEVADGVRWTIPPEQYGDAPQDLTLTAAWRLPRVQVEVPADYWPEGGAAVMAALAPHVSEHLRRQPGECL